MMDGTGFPDWTLWGMGLAAFGALIAITLAFLAQSPRMLTRLKLSGQRLDLRAKTFTGFGLALLLLAMGFFLAGVPLEAGGRTAEVAASTDAAGSPPQETVTDTTDAEGVEEAETGNGQSGAMVGLPTPSPGGASGAMAGLTTPQPTLDPGEVITGTLETEIPLPPGAGTEESPPDETTAEPEATATLTPTDTPTPTPSPTPTPTPILVPTARINDETSTLPIRRLPGGPVLVVLLRGDIVIPLTGNAFYSGEVWQEIQTVDGVIGWVQERFLDYGESDE